MKLINIKNQKNAMRELRKLHLKKYFYNEIKIENVHLKLLNKIIGINIFSKDSMYVAPSTLWAAMKNGGKDRSHNFHNLSPQDVYQAILKIKDADAVYRSKKYVNRYVIVTPVHYTSDTNIIVIIEKGARLVDDAKANINKLVTLYPKDRVSDKNNELLYKK